MMSRGFIASRLAKLHGIFRASITTIVKLCKKGNDGRESVRWLTRISPLKKR
jgi:hypothetical protein